METPRVPARCVDVHVHLHPAPLAEAIQRHFARENWLNAHPFDPEAVAETLVARVRRVMERFPRLRVCVAHMGAFESEAFLQLTDQYPALYVDTTMALCPLAERYVGIRGASITDAQLLRHQDRIVFGSDFPLIPYDYDEERRWAWDRRLPPEVQRKIFRDNALAFLGLAG